MEHLKNFWLTNFDFLPDLKPNYVVPYFCFILRCLSNGNGFTVMPDFFLCKKEIAKKTVQLVRERSPHVESTLYFGKRKKVIYSNETANWNKY